MTKEHSRGARPGATLHLQRRVALLIAASVAAGSLAVVGVIAPTSAAAQAPQKLACTKTYVIVTGDYWYGIARRTGVSLTSLLQANETTATTPLYPGDSICLPDVATAPVDPAPATAPAAPTTVPATSVPAAAVPSSAPAGTVVPLGAFPVQGPCTFGDTFGAPRSGGRLHEGVDIMAKSGQFVYAVASGTLTKQAVDKPGALSGNAWWLTGADKTSYFYAHLSAFAPGLRAGSAVVAGQIIGYVGATGNAGGAHLHFEVHPGGVLVNPTPSVKAVDGCKNRDALPQPGGAVPPPLSAVAAPTTTTPPAPPATTPHTPSPPAAAVAASAGGWQFISPASAFDSARTGQKLAPWATRTVRVDKLSGVEPTTNGVMVRLTASGAAQRGFLVVHRCDQATPTAATLSYSAGATAVGTSIVGVAAGAVCVTSNSAVNLRMEVIASRSAKGGVGLQPISSIRALDTRTTTRLTRGAQVKIDLPALGWVPGTQALSATVTVVGPASAGTLALGLCGQGLWNVPVTADPLSSFAIAMRVGSAGWCLTSTMTTDVVVDVTGLWVGDGALAPVDVTRVYDSRNLGVTVGPSPVAIPIAGQGGVPGGATRAVLSISNVAGGLPGIVFAVPCDGGRSVGVVSAGPPNRISTAVVPVKLGNGAICVSAIEPVDLIIDVIAAG